MSNLTTDDLDHLPHVMIVFRDESPYLQVIEYPDGRSAHAQVFPKTQDPHVLRIIVSARVRQCGRAEHVR